MGEWDPQQSSEDKEASRPIVPVVFLQTSCGEPPVADVGCSDKCLGTATFAGVRAAQDWAVTLSRCSVLLLILGILESERAKSLPLMWYAG